jgi:hypothetical protein
MSAGRYDTVIEQGATFSRTITWKDSDGVGINLTGYTVAGKIKVKVSDKVSLLSLTVTLANQVTYAGQFTISLTATQTASLPVKYTASGEKESLNLYYDIEATLGATVTRILEGVFYNSPEVTR